MRGKCRYNKFSQKVIEIIQEIEYDSLNRDGGSRGSKFILMVRVFFDKLDIGFERKSGIKGIIKILGLNNLKNGVVIEEN